MSYSVYRGDGKRAWKQSATGARTYFFYDGDTLIGTSGDAANSASVWLWGADGLIGTQTKNAAGAVTSGYFLYDAQGNLAQTVSGAGVVSPVAAYTAWGEVVPKADGTKPSLGSLGYGAKFGYWRDSESGLYLCTLRFYDPANGRFVTRDPIGFAGGSNVFGYTGNDPGNGTDPSGLQEVDSGGPLGDLLDGALKSSQEQIASRYVAAGLQRQLLHHYIWGGGEPVVLSRSQVLRLMKPSTSFGNAPGFLQDVKALAPSCSAIKSYHWGAFDPVGGLGHYDIDANLRVTKLPNGTWRASGTAVVSDYWDFDWSWSRLIMKHDSREIRTALGANISGDPFHIESVPINVSQNSAKRSVTWK